LSVTTSQTLRRLSLGIRGAGAARRRRRHCQDIPVGSNHSLAILPWRSWRSWPVTNAHGTKPPGETFAVDPVAIADDVPRWAVFGVGRAVESASHKAFEVRLSERQTRQSMRSHRRGCGGTSSPTGVVIGVAYSVDGANCTWGSVPGPAGASVTIGSAWTQSGPWALCNRYRNCSLAK
jgi:hypothetical protein